MIWKDFESNELRIEPFGADSSGRKIWYFGDLRLYEEKPCKAKPILPLPVNKKAIRKVKAPKWRRSDDSNEDDGQEEDEEESEEDQDSGDSFDIEEESKKEDTKKSKRSAKKPVKVVEVTPIKPLRQSARKRSARRQDIEEDEEINVEDESSKEQPAREEPIKEEEQLDVRSTRSGRRISLIPPKPVKRPSRKKSNLNETTLNETNELGKEQDLDDTLKEEPKTEEIKTETPIDDQTQEQVKTGEMVKAEEIANESELKELKEEIKPEPDIAKPVKKEEVLSRETDQIEESDKVEIKKEEANEELKEEMRPIEKHENIKPEANGIEKNVPVVVRYEKEEYLDELKSWSCICVSLEDWSSVVERYKASKKKADQEIAKKLETNYLPEMPALFQKAEREKMQRVMSMAPKRQSQRLQTKQQVPSENDSNEFLSDLDSNCENSTMTEQERREEIAKQREGPSHFVLSSYKRKDLICFHWFKNDSSIG